MLSAVLNNPQVDVSVAEFKSQRIIVSGSFENTGSVPITSVPVTLSEVIANANPFGELGRIFRRPYFFKIYKRRYHL